MLQTEPAEPAAPPAPAPAARAITWDETDPDQAAAQLRAEYDQRYRPADNPPRINVAARVAFANMGSTRHSAVGGRMGGGSVDVGVAWNRIGIAATLAGYGGRFFLPEQTGAEMNAMFGGGPTLGYGRLALLGRGFLDLRVGYDFYYGVVAARRDGPTVLASQSDGSVVLTQTENLSPHGPRARMDVGLLSHAKRRYFHGWGVSIGYQALVHTLRGELPFSNMLTMGLSYWMG